MIALERFGPLAVAPLVCRQVNARDEADSAVAWLLAQHAEGRPWQDMVVVAPGKRNWRDPLQKALDRAQVPTRMLLGDKGLSVSTGDHVHVMTFHDAGTRTFPVVAVVGVGDLPWTSQSLDDVVDLLRAAMAGATRALRVSHSKPSALAQLLADD